MNTSCAILIYNYESLPFLRTCIRQVQKYKHPEIEQTIIVSEQSKDEKCREDVISEFGDNPDIKIVPMSPLRSGYAIDYVMRFVDIKSKYFCTLDVDAFPIHKNWLYLCLKLIEEYNFAFVGGLAFESRPEDKIYYHKNNFFCMSQFFRVGLTSDYKELSLQGGFTPFHNRPYIDVPMAFGNHDWHDWAREDYMPRGSDSGVIAHCWEDNHREHDKLGLDVFNIMGVLPESGYGRIIDDIVFHFGFSYTSIGLDKEMGEKYVKWKKRINEDYSDGLIEEMLSVARGNGAYKEKGKSKRWDGKFKKTNPRSDELNKRIEELKNL